MHNIPQNGQLRPQQDAIYQDFPPGVRQVNGRHNHILETKGIKITRMRLRDSIHRFQSGDRIEEVSSLENLHITKGLSDYGVTFLMVF